MSCFKLLVSAASLLWVFNELAVGQSNELTAQSNETSTYDFGPSKTLRFVQNFSRDSLKGVVGMATSPDGRFLYAPGYSTATMHAFSIAPQSGRIELLETETDPKVLQGATDFCLSPDGNYGLTSAFGSKAATLFRRDSETGKLTRLSTVNSPASEGKKFQWPIRGAFSTDGKFAYVIDSGMGTSFFVQKKPAVLVFKVSNDQLEFVESLETGGLANMRGIVRHPNGKHIFVVASNGQSLISLRRREDTGKLEVVQVIQESKEQTYGLDGAMSVLVDPSGKYVYTLSGRFRGPGALGIFEFNEANESLEFMELHASGSDGLENFQGGNQLALSPNGKRLYAIGTTQGTISVFQRDPANGKATAIETVAPSPLWKGSVAGVVVSPDSRFVYVSGAERDPSITVLEVRD